MPNGSRYGQTTMVTAKNGVYNTTQKPAAMSPFITLAPFSSRRAVHVVNLDPAAEYFDYQPLVDIRDLVRRPASYHDLYLKKSIKLSYLVIFHLFIVATFF